jgi:hypothetical protein
VAHRDAAPYPERITLTRPTRAGVPVRAILTLAAFTLAAFAIASPPAALAADPTSDPAGTYRPPTCAERFPEDGPGGIDLKLGCIVGEVVGVYVPGQSKPPAPLSSYAILVGIVLIGLASGIWLLGRLVARRASRWLPPVLPSAWWVCATCRSVNGAVVEHCYSCGSARPDGPALLTDDQPSTPQSFGRKRKSG